MVGRFVDLAWIWLGYGGLYFFDEANLLRVESFFLALFEVYLLKTGRLQIDVSFHSESIYLASLPICSLSLFVTEISLHQIFDTSWAQTSNQNLESWFGLCLPCRS